MSNHAKTKRAKLGEWLATAICGNDILSSTLYVSGIAIIFAGVWAPVVFLAIGAILWLYKLVYTEVVEALPINGGAYNCLLNGTSKTIAAIAGVATFLSYVATAVISAKIGVEYLMTIVPRSVVADPRELVIPGTLLLLALFAALVISGIKDSARVALGIFIFHIASLTLFIGFGVFYYVSGYSHFAENLLHTSDILTRQGGLMPALYLAFAASLLGVSGFESSANFVEEQKPGVFRKTLRNMLVGVIIFNPIIALVVLNSLPFEAISTAKDFLLAIAAREIGGSLLQYIVAIDAFLVLSGAVLTSYIGVSGLLSRMASDNCLPLFLGAVNKKGAHPRITTLFLILCASILLITHGSLLSLAGVYTIAFLSVMTLFAIGNLILKESRPELKRTYTAPYIAVVIAFLATSFGVIGNIRIDEQNLVFFELYFFPTVAVVFAIIYRDRLARFLLRISRHFPALHEYIQKYFEDMTLDRFAVFVHRPDRLYKKLEYIHRNETGWRVTIVCCRDESGGDPKNVYNEVEKTLPILQKAGVFPHLITNVVYQDMPFGPVAITEASRKLHIPANRIFIGAIHDFHTFDYQELSGVRIIAD